MADPTTADGLVGNTNAVPTTTSLTGNTPPGTFIGTGSSVAENADYVGGVNVTNLAEDIVTAPSDFLASKDATLSDRVTTIDAGDPANMVDKNNYFMDVDGLQGSAAQASTAQASQVTAPNKAATYTAVTTGTQTDALNQSSQAATTAVNNDAMVDVNTFDMKGLATGVNKDGSTNAVGVALNSVATQNMSNIVDTSTVSGKLLAQRLGEGNYTDAKTQVTYWMEELSKDFVDANGNPTIPAYASAAVRGVSRMLAIRGVTGTASLSAIAQATMETIMPVATASAQFYQTLTVKNLDAKNTQILNTANILSKMNVTDLDARMNAAVTNAKSVMTYDMANLSNEQQMAVVKYQGKQQSILEDAKQQNVASQFGAEATNTMDRFYDQLGSQIDMFNVEARNAMSKFNTGETNSMEQFNLQMENQREQFYMSFQKEIDESNAKWRQTVTLTNNQTLNNAAATDVKNIVDLTTEQMNQMWDRTDALLDYSFKESESEKDRRMQIQVAEINYDAQIQSSKSSGSPFGKLLGSVAGAVIGSAAGPVGSKIGSTLVSSMFGDE